MHIIFAYKLILAVCGHNHPTVIKIHSLPFLIPQNPKQSQLSSRFDFLSSMMSYCSGPAHNRWSTVQY